MVKVGTITIIFTVISFVLVFLLGQQGILVKPLLVADVQDGKSNNNSTTLTIKNIGFAQAKKAEAIIVLSHPHPISQNLCFEGNLTLQSSSKYKINFERLSTGISCVLEFNGLIKNELSFITISADDASGFQWNSVDEIIQKIQFIYFSLIATTIVSIVAGVSASISLHRWFMRKQRQKVYTQSEEEITRDIKLTTEDIKEFYSELERTTDSSISNSVKTKIEMLDERLRNLYSQLDQARSRKLTSGELDEIVGKFFNKWALLEQQLVQLANKNDIDFIRSSPSILVKELQKKEIIDSNFVTPFSDLRVFRNNLVHGNSTPNKKQIETYLQMLQSLLDSLSKINPA